MMTPSSRNVLGIMTTQTEGTPPFLNRGFYRRLTLAGSKAGISVYVFSPQSINWLAGSIQGYIYDSASNQWLRRHCSFPDAVYDRCFFTSRQQYTDYSYAVRKLREHRSVLFLGYGLKGKTEVQRLLERDGRFNSHLPQTETMRNVRSVADWLKAHGQVLLKPQSGSQGRGVLLVQRIGAASPGAAAALSEHGSGAARTRGASRPAAVAPGARDAASPGAAAALSEHGSGAARTRGASRPAFAVRGRDARNRRVARGFADAPALLRWLRRFTAQRVYLQQQYLLLQACTGDAYDVRSLVQKNGTGRWQVTGMAVRLGQSGSLTSNLHGGGTAQPAEAFLVRQFGTAEATRIMNKLRELSAQIPEALETHHGRLVELGIDFGVDTAGQIWILEINSKPGRSIFTYLHDSRAHSDAITNPIRYTRYLLHNRA